MTRRSGIGWDSAAGAAAPVESAGEGQLLPPAPPPGSEGLGSPAKAQQQQQPPLLHVVLGLEAEAALARVPRAPLERSVATGCWCVAGAAPVGGFSVLRGMATAHCLNGAGALWVKRV